MLSLILLGLFLPQTVTKNYPPPDPKCLYKWISDDTKLENTCVNPLVVDVAYEDGRGTHKILTTGEVLEIRKLPLKVFMCTQGKGVPSAKQDHLVHPGYKTMGYSCLAQELQFPALGKDWNIK